MSNALEAFSLIAKPLAERIFHEIRELSATPGGAGVTRLGYTAKEREVAAKLADFGRELGLIVERDAAGNLLMTLPGSDPSLPALFCGSHSDSVLDGGNYDGLAGIAAALATAAALKAQGAPLRRSFTVAVIRCEEQGLIGSKAMMGQLTKDVLDCRWGEELPTLRTLLIEEGLDPERLVDGRRAHNKPIGAFLELHIEQGLRLDRPQSPRVGIVTGIRGMFWHRNVVVRGQTAHAGAIDYAFRRDALAAAVSMLSEMNDRWHELAAKEEDLVLTTGVFETKPTAAFNKIPGYVRFSLDMRSMNDSLLENFYGELRDCARRIERRDNVSFVFDAPGRTPAMICDEHLMRMLDESAASLAVPVLHEPSGAGHDAQTFALAGIPCAMVFIANQNGSHNPREAIRMEDFLAGAAVLKETAARFCA